LQIDNSGYITNDGAACGTGNGTVNTGASGQIAYYSGNGTTLAGTGAVPVVAGGTGASTVAGALANLGGMSLAQTSTQTMAGSLNLPMLEGTLNADQAQSPSGVGNNGIINSITQCASMAYECSILAPALYSMTEGQPFGGAPLNYYPPILNGPASAQALGGSSVGYNSLITSGPKPTQPTAMFLDMRYGVPQWIFNQSQPVGTRFLASPTFAMNSVSGPGAGPYGAFANALLLQNMAFGGGRNFYNDKTNLATLSLQSYKYTQAQGGGDIDQYVLCIGNGDCVGHTIDTISYGGPNTTGDEGNESMRFEAIEGGQVFGANVSSITTGTDGSITVATSSQTNKGFVGEGRLLIDLTQKYNAGYISSIAASGGNEIVTCTGCAWDSTFGTSTQTTLSAAVANPVSGTNSFPQPNVTLVVASSTGFTVGNLACIWDYDYECEEITAVGTGAVTIATDRLPHPAGAYVTTGGLAGRAIEFEADRVTPGNTNGIATNPDSGLVSTIRNAIPVMYNSSGNQLAFFQSGNTLPGQTGQRTGRAYLAMGSGGSVALTVAGGVVTSCTASGGTGYSGSGNPPVVAISGSYTTAPLVYVYNSQNSAGALNTCVVKNPGTGVTSATATIVPTNPYDIYPATKVTGVYNVATGAVDGTLYAEPPAGTFAAGDAVEQPHYFWQHTAGSNNVVGQYIPSLGGAAHNAVSYGMTGVWQGSDAGFVMRNNTNPLVYEEYPAGTPWIQGLGQLIPPYAVSLSGPFRSHINVDTPPYGSTGQGVITVGCGSLGCANWTSGYNVLAVAGNGGSDGLSYNPSTRAWVLSGNSFSLNTSGGGNVPIVSGSPTTGHLALWGGGTPETLIDGGAPAGSGTALMTGPTSTVANDGACFADSNGTLMDCGFAPGTVKSFGAPSVNWPSWMVPTVANGTSTPSLSVAVTSIPNSALANAATTVNGQSCALGGNCAVTVAAGTLTGSTLAATVTGSSLTSVGTVTSGMWQGTAISPTYVSTGTSGANIPLLNGTNTWSASTTTFANGAASADYVVIKPGLSADQIGALEFANYAGTSQWEVRKDASNTFRIRDTVNSLDRFVQYAGGQTVINSGGTAAVAINNTSSAGTGGFTVYEGGTNYNTLAFSVTSSGNANVTGTLTSNSLTDSSVASAALLGTNSTGSLVAETMSGDATLATGGALTLATVNSSAGSYGSSTLIPAVTVNSKGLVTAVTTNAAVAPAMAFTTLTDGSTVTLATGGLGVTNATLTLNHSTATRTLNVTGLASGANFTVVLKQDSTGGAALTFGTGCTWYLGTNAGFAASTGPSLTAAASGINVMSVLYDGANCYANVR
jgi:hypothetical protein